MKSPSLRTVQEIVDDGTALNNHLIALADEAASGTSPDVTARILAVGLTAIHDRLGDIWILLKEQRA